MTEPYIDPEEAKYLRYSPEVYVDAVRNKGKIDYSRLIDKPEPEPMWVDIVDAVAPKCGELVESKWQEVRPFILDPGDPAKIRAAADAWKPAGEDGGSNSMFATINEWKAEAHDIVYRLGKRWQDDASESLDRYLEHKVDGVLEALESRCEAYATALRSMAEAHEELQKTIDDSVEKALVGTGATVGLGLLAWGSTSMFTAGTSTPAVATLTTVALVPLISSLIISVYGSWMSYRAFEDACADSLDKLGVDTQELGDGQGHWPRPWSR